MQITATTDELCAVMEELFPLEYRVALLTLENRKKDELIRQLCEKEAPDGGAD